MLGGRAECDADTDLPGAAPDVERQHAIDSDGSEQERESGKHADELRPKRSARDGFGDTGGDRTHVVDRFCGGHLPQFGPSRVDEGGWIPAGPENQ